MKMFCQQCGYQVVNQEFCPSCGARQMASQTGPVYKPDNPSGLLNAVACCFPIVGLILFFVWKDEKPLSARSAGKWALIGFILGIVLYGIFFALGLLSELMFYY